MTRWARPDNFGHRVRTPLLRKHWVYRAYDANGDLLYAGCTYDPDARMAAHRSQSDWHHLMVKLTMGGPYNYETARALEYQALASERPLYGFGPDRRTIIAARRRIYDRKFAVTPGPFLDRCCVADAHAEALIPYPGNRAPFRITDLTVRAALRTDAQDAISYAKGATA